MKRLLDLIVCFTLIIILFLPIIIICFIIKIDTKGPITNVSKRVGKNKRMFKMFKFRTMIINTPIIHSNDLKNPNQFITKTGKVLRKYSLDEIPQIINILKGEMSFVGPRPALENQYDLIKKRDQFNLHDIKPGLTGLAQINGRDNISMEKKVELDEYYKNNQSFLLDMKIIIKTILIVLFSEDIKH